MKEHGILFTAPMVRAILAGTKTQTRRIAKAPKGWVLDGALHIDFGVSVLKCSRNVGDESETEIEKKLVRAPHGPVGRRLWVRETVGVLPEYPDALTMPEYEGGHDPHRLLYRADEPRKLVGHYGIDWSKRRWRPAIHMPRWASRITLEVTRVRLERVQSITEDDARAEGVVGEPCDHVRQSCEDIGCCGPTARGMYGALWDEINGKPKLSRGGKAKSTAYPWASNPWVWAYDFKRVE